MKTKLMIALRLAFLVIGPLAHCATITWTNTSGGNWSVASNWSPNQIPGPGDNANINSAGTYTVTDDVTVAISFRVGGAPSGVQNLRVANGVTLTCAAGSAPPVPVVEANGTLTVASGGTLNVSVALNLSGPVTNSGTINLPDGSGGIAMNSGGSGIVNLTGGQINLAGPSQGGGGITGLAQSYLINQGMITKSSGTNLIWIASLDNSQGAITNLSGTLWLRGFQGTLAGIFSAAPGAAIQFSGTAGTPLVPGIPLSLAGGGQFEFIGGWLRLPTNLIPNLVLYGDTLDLGGGFQGGAITNLTLNGITLTNTLPVTGTLTATNSPLDGSFTVANGGVLNAHGVTENAGVTVGNGGSFTVNDATIIGSSGWVTVASGGKFNVGDSYLTLDGALTNSGTINLTNFGISLENDGTVALRGGLVNQPGGLINLWGASQTGGNYGHEYLINRGMITENAGSGSLILVSSFDNSLGTVTNLSGTLFLHTFQGTLAGSFYAALGAVINLGGGSSAVPLVPGTPLLVSGPGVCQYIGDESGSGGFLKLPADIIPNLLLTRGTLELGAGFQGGAITNLTLNFGLGSSGMTLTNTLPVTGTFTVTNSPIYGNFTIQNGGVFNARSTPTGGLPTKQFGAVTVANGGTYAAFGSTVAPSGSLTLASGGRLIVGTNNLNLLGPLTNAGTINLTNNLININNDGTAAFQGGLLNQPGGLIEFWGTGFISGNGGQDYLINHGNITESPTASHFLGAISISSFTNDGAITATGVMFLGHVTLLPAGSLNLSLSSKINYPQFVLSGNETMSGAFNVTLNNGYVPANGDAFILLSYGSASGNFTSMGLPPAVSWQPTYGSTAFSLLVGTQLRFGTVNLSGTNLLFSGIGGTAGSNYVVLASTNLTIPLTNCLALTTNTFDGSGQFHYTNNVNPAKPRQFFIFKLP